MEQFVVKVAHDSHVGSVGGSIAKAVREFGKVEVRAVGAGAVNQAVKGSIRALEHLLNDGINAVIIPRFEDLEIDGRKVTAVVLLIEPR